MNFFWDEHIKHHGNFTTIPILDYCRDHKCGRYGLTIYIAMIILPPNLINWCQSEYIGIISDNKFGYKALFLLTMLDIFDASCSLDFSS